MDWRYTILILVAIINLVWGFYIWWINPRNKINILFALMVFSCSVWAATSGIRDGFVTNSELVILMNQLAFLSPSFIVFFFFIFTHYYPYAVRPFTITSLMQSIAIFAIISVLIFSNSIIIGAVKTNGAWVYEFNRIGYLMFSIYSL